MNDGLSRQLGFWDAVSIIAGIMIGAGIFAVPGIIARSVPSPSGILAVWVFAGALSFLGALAYAELGAMMPHTGGHYVYLREAFGPLAAFLSGWISILIVQPGAIAFMATSFTIYLGQFVELNPVAGRAVSLGLVALLCWANYRGVRHGALVQNVFTGAKLLGLALIIGAAARLGAPAGNAWGAPSMEASSFGVALISCLLAYDGWSYASFVAGEIRQPEKNLLRALVAGVALSTALYVAANLAYLAVLPLAEIVQTERVGARVAELALGPAGAALVTLTVLASIVGALNGEILAPSRVYFAQARDGLFFRRFGEIHPRFRTPHWALAGQGVWAGVLTVSGAYEFLIDYAMLAQWIVYGVTVAGLIRLRRTRPDAPRPYRMWGYPVTPALFCLTAAWFAVNTVMERPTAGAAALAIIAAGVPVYFLARPR